MKWLKILQRSVYKVIKLVADDWKIPSGVAISALIGLLLNSLYPNSPIAGIIYIVAIFITFISIVFVLGTTKAP